MSLTVNRRIGTPVEDQILAKTQAPITQWKDYKVNVTFLQTSNDLEEENIEEYLPFNTGFGTTYSPDKVEPGWETTYVAWVLFVSGFFLVFPWLGAIRFVKSQSRLARLAAISSLIMLPAWIIAIIVYLKFGQNVM